MILRIKLPLTQEGKSWINNWISRAFGRKNLNCSKEQGQAIVSTLKVGKEKLSSKKTMVEVDLGQVSRDDNLFYVTIVSSFLFNSCT